MLKAIWEAPHRYSPKVNLAIVAMEVKPVEFLSPSGASERSSYRMG